MQDWNVDPHWCSAGHRYQRYQTYVDAGFEVRGILDNGATTTPIRSTATREWIPYGFEALENMTRWDGPGPLEWFEYHQREAQAQLGRADTEE